jgi:hypothetical protein
MRQRTNGAIPTIALLLFAAVAGTFRLRAYDLFWHLASGRWIIEHRALPATDPFRFTSEAAPWVDHEWLFQIVARFVETLAGMDGLVVFRAATVVLLAAVVLLSIRRSGAPVPGAVIAVAAAVLLARPRFMVRPELFSLLALAVLLSLLQEYRHSSSRSGMASAVLLVVAWANVHAAVVVAPVVAAAYLVGSRLPTSPASSRLDRVSGGRVVIFPATLALAAMANPSGWKIYAVPFEIRSALKDLAVVNPEWLPAWVAPQPALIGGALALVILVVWAAVRSGGIDGATGLSTLALAVLAVSGVRHQGLFFVGAAFLAGESLADVARHPRGMASALTEGSRSAIAVAACLLAAGWCVFTPPSGPLRARQGPYSFGRGLEPGRFPVAAVEAMESRPETGRVYNDVAFGGYLIWRLYPRRVFIDGRNEVNPQLLREVTAARSDSRAWSALIERNEIGRALVRYDDRLVEVTAPAPSGAAPGSGPAVSRHTPNALLFPSRAFALVYWDDVAMLFVRRSAVGAGDLERDEYRYVHPEDRGATLQAAAADSGYLAGALAEIDRRLAEAPASARALAIRKELEAVRASTGGS